MFEFIDEEIGKVVVIPHKRAKHIIARRKGGHIQLTVPQRFNLKNIPSVLRELKPKIKSMKPPSVATLSENDVISSFTFDARIVRDSFIEKISLSLKNGKLLVLVPSRYDISQPEIQKTIREAIIGVLRMEAKRVLPEKTAFFAQKHQLTYHQININKSKSRWGSCSIRKNINFSLFLLLLPEKLIDYVVLHELAHTVEMNHSDNFWKLLDRFCDGNARMLSKEVKKQRPEGYDFLVQE
jgi:Predicted metal-dependent hydrolase